MKLLFPTIPTANLRTDPYFKWSLRVSFSILALSYFLLLFYWQRLPPVVPFFYSLPWGEDQLASPIALIFLISQAVLLYTINALWALLIYKTYPYYGRVLLISATVISLLTTITTVNILFLIL